MNPAFLDSMSWEMAEVYGAISDQILINLAHYFPYFKVDKLPTSAFAYQSVMLAQMGQVNRETARIIARGLDGANEALENAIEQAIISSVRSREPELYKAVKKGILQPPGQIPIITPNQTRAFSLYYKQAADKLNLVNTVMLESTQQAYQMTVSDIVSRMRATQTALDIGAGETITGVSSWNSAMEHAISRMKDNGITGFIDHAGRHWSAEAYAAMDIRTTVYNTARAAVWEMNQDFGNDLYIVSYHSGARPLCYDWQNKVISALNNARDTVDLDGNPVHVYAQSETTYGEPAGLFGINCKHYPNPFIPGVTRVGQTPETPEQNEKAYQESQTQRRLERKIREEKRDLEMLKAQNAPDNLIQAQRDMVKATSQQINDFCDQTGRARHRDREAVYTRREFPSMKTYDPRQFVADQKNMIDKYFADGGAQREFKFGTMTPVMPLVPNPKPPTPTPTPTPAPVPNIVPPQNVAPQATTTPEPVIHSKAGDALLKRLQSANVAERPVSSFSSPLTPEQIISRVGGGDKTQGSCASLAWTYAGNKNGLDVLDFRDGASRYVFSNRLSTELIANLDGVVSEMVESGNDFKAVHELQKAMIDGKEYVLCTGRHASIIRKVNQGFEYLELQSGTIGGDWGNGWHTLTDETLKWRFSCKRSHSTYGMKFELKNFIVDVDSLKGNADFKEILGYINTAADQQRKGVSGGLR